MFRLLLLFSFQRVSSFGVWVPETLNPKTLKPSSFEVTMVKMTMVIVITVEIIETVIVVIIVMRNSHGGNHENNLHMNT